MPGPTTEIEIQSAAVQLLGKPSFTTLANAGEFGVAAKTGYDLFVGREMAAGPWRFCAFVEDLAQIANFDPDYKGWTTAYQLPANLLNIQSMDPQIPYEIFKDRIYTGHSGTLRIEYRKEVAVPFWPETFKAYFVHRLAHWLALSVAESAQIAGQIKVEMQQLRAEALYIDSQNRPSRGIYKQPYIDVRR